MPLIRAACPDESGRSREPFRRVWRQTRRATRVLHFGPGRDPRAGRRERVGQVTDRALPAATPAGRRHEPNTALDVTIQAQILKLLAELKTARGLALLLISHDLEIVRRYGDRVCVMKDGAIVEAGRVADVFSWPQHPYTRMLVAAQPSG